jgi:superfamily I DNA and/or RNA helicase
MDLPGEDRQTVWVGSPLRVHRRCERTMFDLSNAIAYQGMMVYGTQEKEFPTEERPYPKSCWVDVVSSEARGKWVPSEGEALVTMLAKLHDNGVERDRIRVLSPFRDVIRGCRGIVEQKLGWYEFAQEHIDTIHKMQGREADVVIIVLGTHPQHGLGSRTWAARTPNLLNVAVSRAKRRMFVIGNRTEWKELPYFRELTDLPVHPWNSAIRP